VALGFIIVMMPPPVPEICRPLTAGAFRIQLSNALKSPMTAVASATWPFVRTVRNRANRSRGSNPKERQKCCDPSDSREASVCIKILSNSSFVASTAFNKRLRAISVIAVYFIIRENKTEVEHLSDQTAINIYA
jgi:hypothetical protein